MYVSPIGGRHGDDVYLVRILWNFVLSFAPRYLAFKIDFDRRDAHVVHLQHEGQDYMYRILTAMKIKHKMCGGKAAERVGFLFSLASPCYSGQTDRPNVPFWGVVAHLKWDLLRAPCVLLWRPWDLGCLHISSVTRPKHVHTSSSTRVVTHELVHGHASSIHTVGGQLVQKEERDNGGRTNKQAAQAGVLSLRRTARSVTRPRAGRDCHSTKPTVAGAHKCHRRSTLLACLCPSEASSNTMSSTFLFRPFRLSGTSSVKMAYCRLPALVVLRLLDNYSKPTSKIQKICRRRRPALRLLSRTLADWP